MSGERDELAAAGGKLSCPSAQPDMEGARVFGVISGTVQEPRVAYLKAEAVVTRAMLAKAAPADPTHVFRFAAACEEARCVHFDGRRCLLAGRIVEKLDPVVDALPPCLIRPTCRWYAEQGAAACYRCPQVVTLIPKAEDRLNQAARPPQDGPEQVAQDGFRRSPS
jgi:hypothetical protein